MKPELNDIEKPLKEKLYFFHLEIRDGDSEYLSPHIVKAKNSEEATKKAEKYGQEFYQCCKLGGFVTDKNPDGDHSDNCGDYRIVRTDGVGEMTVEQIIQRLTI